MGRGIRGIRRVGAAATVMPQGLANRCDWSTGPGTGEPGSHWPHDGVCMCALPSGVGVPGSCFEISEILARSYRPAETFRTRAVEDRENENRRNHDEPSKSGREKRGTKKYTKQISRLKNSKNGQKWVSGQLRSLNNRQNPQVGALFEGMWSEPQGQFPATAAVVCTKSAWT